MKIELNFDIPENYSTDRLDQALAQLQPEYSRAQWQQWIKAGFISIDGETITKTRYKVKPLQKIAVVAQAEKQGDWQAQAIPLDIIFEDNDIIVINKPAGLVVHPGAGNPDHTLVNALLHYDPELAHIPRAGIVHRIDKDTSGLLVVARNLNAHNMLTQMISERLVKREYQAIVHGEIISGGTIDAAIDRHPTQRIKMAVKEGGRDAVTHYRIIKKFPHATHLKCELESGRTHQIRVHLSHIGHPIIGDPIYGYRRGIPGKLSALLRDTLNNFPRQALHAWQLSFDHPISKEPLHFSAPLPQDMHDLLTTLCQHD